jgi:hypothetical protein
MMASPRRSQMILGKLVDDLEAIDGLSEVDRLGVEIGFFDFCVGTHHEVRAPERNLEHSIGNQVVTLNVGFMERLRKHYVGAVCIDSAISQADSSRVATDFSIFKVA